MNKTISIIRIATLFLLGLVALLLIFGEEDANSSTWMLRLIIDKILGIGACFAIARLYKRWSKIDPWFIAYNSRCDEEIDNSQF